MGHFVFRFLTFIFSVSLLPWTAQASEKSLKKVSIVITQFVSHGALDAVRDGAMESIQACAKGKFDVEFDLTNASSNTIIARQIAQKHASDQPDVIVAISTLSAQSVLSAVKGRIPLVFWCDYRSGICAYCGEKCDRRDR